MSRYVLHIALLLVCGFGLIHAIQFGIASLHYYHVDNAIDLWDRNQGVYSQAPYQNVHTHAELAIAWHEDNAQYQNSMGQVLEWGWLSDPSLRNTAQLRKAKAHYLRSLDTRPTWPITWAMLSVIKWRMQEFDPQLHHYLTMADKFGPFKPEVHLLYTNLGLTLLRADHTFLLQIYEKFEQHLLLALSNPTTRALAIQALNANQIPAHLCQKLNALPALFRRGLMQCKP